MKIRRSLALGGATFLLVVGLLALSNHVYVPFTGGALAIHDSGSLPGRLHLCGRTWGQDALKRTFSAAIVEENFGAAPTLADPRLFAPCPAGACTATAGGPCATVIFVRVGEDAYVDYSLAGGP